MNGLDCNFKREPFGELLQCITYCNNIIKLNAMCMNCNDGTLAPYTKRIITYDKEILVKDKKKNEKETYIALCRTCFNQN